MVSNRHCLSGSPRNRIMLAVVAVIVLAPAAALAQGIRTAVKANPGEIVLTRNVPTRIAYRQPVSPGMALLINPMPNQQINSALGLGTGELSDADVAGLSATPRSGNSTAVANAVNNALAGSVGSHADGNSIPMTGNVAGGSMGAIGNATSGIGGQVTGALSQIPMVSMPAGSGH